jgi:hypothetical protein
LWHRTNLTGLNPLPSRFTAGACGFLNLSQSGDRPDRYRDPSRFDDAFDAQLAGMGEDKRSVRVLQVLVQARPWPSLSQDAG